MNIVEKPIAVSKPDIMGGERCLKGTRIPMRYFNGLTIPEITECWPHLTYEQAIYAYNYWKRS